MNMKVVLLFLLTLVILAGAPASFAKPQYLASLNTVYGNGLCGTCHVNGESDGTRTSYGALFENQPNHAADPSAALRAIGAPPCSNPNSCTNFYIDPRSNRDPGSYYSNSYSRASSSNCDSRSPRIRNWTIPYRIIRMVSPGKTKK